MGAHNDPVALRIQVAALTRLLDEERRYQHDAMCDMMAERDRYRALTRSAFSIMQRMGDELRKLLPTAREAHLDPDLRAYWHRMDEDACEWCGVQRDPRVEYLEGLGLKRGNVWPCECRVPRGTADAVFAGEPAAHAFITGEAEPGHQPENPVVVFLVPVGEEADSGS